MRRIARTLAVTPMALYHHYRSREALLQAVADAEFERLATISERMRAAGKSRRNLTKAVDAYLEYALDRPRVFDFVFNVRRRGARRYPADFRAGRSPTLNPVADDIGAAMRAGELKVGDRWEIALQLWAQAHGYISLWRAGRFDLSEKDFRALYHRAVKRLLTGLEA
jgi:AcrR family transcriptional regulator